MIQLKTITGPVGILFLLAALLAFSGCAHPAKQKPPVPEVPGSQILTPEQMRQDLEFTIQTLREVHPQTRNGFSAEQETLFKTLRASVDKPMEAHEFYLLAGRALCSMKDGHTKLQSSDRRQNRSVKIPLSWFTDGLYVTRDCEPFRAGDRVVAVGGRPIGELIEELGRFIPSENAYWLQYSAAQALTREGYLKAMGLIRNNAVEWTIRRNGMDQTISTGWFKGAVENSIYPRRHWVGHTIAREASLAIFHLDHCRWNDEYREGLKRFFTEVRDNRIQHVVVDLRRNGGGNSMVVQGFLSYLDIEHYKSFRVGVRYSRQSAEEHHTPRSGWRVFDASKERNRKCPDPGLIYRGRLYVLTAIPTYSAAMDFAVTIKDNRLGTIIGEPTGNMPSCYGDCLGFQMPNTGFRFNVSFKHYRRPEPANDPTDAVYPDIPIFTTIEDVLQRRDPQMERVREIVRAAATGSARSSSR